MACRRILPPLARRDRDGQKNQSDCRQQMESAGEGIRLAIENLVPKQPEHVVPRAIKEILFHDSSSSSGDFAIGSYPRHSRTGNLGYFGKLGSVADSSHL